MAAPRSAGGLTTGQGASELTSIPLPASARRGPAQTPAPPAVPAQVGVDALLGTPAATVPLQIEPLPEVRVRSVSVPLPQPSQETIQLQGMKLEAEGALRDEMFRAEADRQRLAEQYAAAVAAPLPEMEPRPRLPDAPVMRNWQEAVRDQMPVLALIAVLGAAGTRQPLINAMNAMTGATLALQKGQYDEYERNLRQWEIESKVALDKVQAWQDKRKEILNNRNLTIEQKKAMLEVMDSNAGKRRELLQWDVDRIGYYLKQSEEADKAIQEAREATARLQQTAENTNARLTQSGEIAGRRLAMSQAEAIRRDSVDRLRIAHDTQRLVIEKLRALNEQKRYASEEKRRELELVELNLKIEGKKASIEEKAERLKIAKSEAEQNSILKEIEIDKRQLEVDKLRRAEQELDAGQFAKAKELKRQFDKETGYLFDGLIAMETIVKIRQSPTGYQLATDFLLNLSPKGGRRPTNQQANEIKNTGDLGTRIENTYSMFLTGKPGPQAIDDLNRLMKDMARLYRKRLAKKIDDMRGDVVTQFPASGEQIQSQVFDLVVPDTIPGQELMK